eukprot:1615405-Rhodomonas_salina.5
MSLFPTCSSRPLHLSHADPTGQRSAAARMREGSEPSFRVWSMATDFVLAGVTPPKPSDKLSRHSVAEVVRSSGRRNRRALPGSIRKQGM